MKNLDFKSLKSSPIQIWANNTTPLFDIMEWCLKEMGGDARSCITTFSTSEEFIRKVKMFKDHGLINYVEMVADYRGTEKTVNLLPFIENVFDKLYLASNHSKIILLENANYQISIITSQNQTRGNRFETGAIFTSPGIYDSLNRKLNKLINEESTIFYEIK